MRVGFIIAGVFAGLLVLVAIVPRFIDWTAQRQWIEAGLAAALDEPVRINGAVEAVVLPSPALIAQDISIGGPDRSVEADIGALEARLRLGPLFGGRLEVERLVLRDATLDTRDTPPSEQDRPPESDTPRVGDPRLTLDDVELTNLTWRVDGETLVFPNASLSARSLSGPFSASGVITWEGADVSFDLGLEALRPDRPAGATVSLAWPDGATAVFSGSADHSQSPWQFSGRLSGQAPSPLNWLSALELSYPAAFNDGLESRLDARVLGNFSALVFEDVRLALGRSRLTGTAALDWTGPYMAGDATLSFGQLDLDQLLSPDTAPRADVLVSTDQTISAVPSETSAATGWSLNLVATADLISWRGGVLSNARLRGLANGEGLTLEAASAQLPGATSITGTGRVPWNSRGEWDLDWQGSTANARALATWAGLGQAVRALPPGRFSGAVVTGRLAGLGRDLRIDLIDALIDQTALAGTLYPWGEGDALEFDLRVPSLTLDMVLPAGLDQGQDGSTVASQAPEGPPPFGGWQGRLAIGSLVYQGRRATNVMAAVRDTGPDLYIEELEIGDVEGVSMSLSDVPLSPNSWSDLDQATIALNAPNAASVLRLLDQPPPGWIPDGALSLAVVAAGADDGGLSLTMDGAAGDHALNGTVALQGANLSIESWQAELSGSVETSLFGRRFTELGLGPRAELVFRGNGAGSRADVETIQLRGAGGQLDGSGWVTTDNGVAQFSGDVVLAGGMDRTTGEVDTANRPATTLQRPGVSNAPLELDWITTLDGQINVRMDRAVFMGLPPLTGSFTTQFDGVSVVISSLDLAIGTGRASGTGRVLATEPGFTADISISELPLDPDRTVSLTFEGGASGPSTRAWMRSLTGQGRYAASADPSADQGRLSLSALMAPFDGLAAIGRFLARPQGRSALETDFEVAAGVIGFEDLRFTAPSYQGVFDGRFDLNAWDLETSGRVDLIGSTISRLLGQQVRLPGVLPIEVTGDPAEPRIKVDISGGLLPN